MEKRISLHSTESDKKRQSVTHNLQRDEAEKALQHSRKKKDNILNDIKKQQTRFFNLSHHQNTAINYAQSPSSPDRRDRYLEEQVPSSTCCFCFFKRRSRIQNISVLSNPNNSSYQGSTVEGGNTLRISEYNQFLQSVLMDYNSQQLQSNEWYKYLFKNLKSMEGLFWIDQLMKFLKENELDFKLSRFRGQIFFLNYSKNQLLSVPQRVRLNSMHRASKDLSMTSLDKIPISRQNNNNILPDLSKIESGTSENSNNYSINKAHKKSPLQAAKSGVLNIKLNHQDSNTNTNKLNENSHNESSVDLQNIYYAEQLLAQTKFTENHVKNYLYGIENSLIGARNNNKYNTLDQMEESVVQLFFIIKNQLQDAEHPLNVVIQQFRKNFVEHYTDQIMRTNNTEYYIIREVNKDFQIAFFDDSERIEIEANFQDDDTSKSRPSRSMSFERGEGNGYRKNSITDRYNSQQMNMPPNLKKASFMKRKSEAFKQKQQKMRYKMSEAAIIEVKQFLCVMYGCCVRFYNTVIKQEILEQMKEDLIEALTKLVFRDRMSSLLLAFARVSTRDHEEEFHEKLRELASITPKLIGVGQYFTLDQSSKIEEIFIQQQVQLNQGGDIGGSTTEFDQNELNYIQRSHTNMRLTDHESSINRSIVDIEQNAIISHRQAQPHLSENIQAQRWQGIDQDQQQDEDQEDYTSSLDCSQIIDDIASSAQINEEFKDDQAHQNIVRDVLEEVKYQVHENNASERSFYMESENSDSLNQSDQVLHGLNQTHNKRTIISIDVIQERLRQRPYERAIKEMMKISECETPIEKIRCISNVSKHIVKCVNNFWTGIKVKKEKLTIDGDTLLMIFIYVCVRSRLNELFAHVKIMNEFSTPFVRTTKLGYVMSTMEVALNHILNLGKEDFVSDDTYGVNTRPKSFQMMVRQSLQNSARTVSLKILDDPFDEYFRQMK